MREFRSAVMVIGLCLGPMIIPAAASAQTGPYLRPSLSVAEVFDDNIFFTPSGQGREHDFITRFTPDIKAGYRSTPLTVTGRYTFDAEIYTEHPELTSPQIRQQGTLGFTSRPNRLLTMELEGSYFQTRTPFELNVLTGVAIRRALAERYTASPAVTYRPDLLTTASMDYTYSMDQLSGAPTIETHVADLTLDHRISRRDAIGPGYTLRRFTFGGQRSTTMHTATMGWEGTLTPVAGLSLRAGPRLVDGGLDDQPEIEASLRYRLKRGAVTLAYTNTLTSLIGQPGAVRTNSVIGSFSHAIDLGVFPLDVAQRKVDQRLLLTAGPGFSRIQGGGFSVDNYLAGLEASYRLNKWVSLTSSYQFSFQKGRFNPLTGAIGGSEIEVLHNVFFLRLSLTGSALSN